jgi:hypothetical protein
VCVRAEKLVDVGDAVPDHATELDKARPAPGVPPALHPSAAWNPPSSTMSANCTLNDVTRRFGPGDFRISAYRLTPPALLWEVLARDID